MKRRLYQLTIIIASLFVIQGFSRSLVELWQQKQRLSKAKEEVMQLDGDIDVLKKELAYHQSDEYVEKIAREKLMMGKEGETVIVLPKGDNDGMINDQLPMTNDDADIPNWQKWARLFGW